MEGIDTDGKRSLTPGRGGRSGLIGSALAGHLILAGNKVTIGARWPEAFTPPDYQREDIEYHVRTIDEAVDGVEMAIRAIPNAAVAGFADLYCDRLAGAIIIDPFNRFLWHDGGVMTIKDLGGKTSATVTAKLFPQSSVVRAFSHQLAETLWLRGRREAGTWAIGYAADDDDTAESSAHKACRQLSTRDHSLADRGLRSGLGYRSQESSCGRGMWLLYGELCQLVDERRGNAHRQAQRRLIPGGQHVK
jgi:predicted dinucleotide-binding enzyme